MNKNVFFLLPLVFVRALHRSKHRHIEDHDHNLASMMDHVFQPVNEEYRMVTNEMFSSARTSWGNCLQNAARQTAIGVLEETRESL